MGARVLVNGKHGASVMFSGVVEGLDGVCTVEGLAQAAWVGAVRVVR